MTKKEIEAVLEGMREERLSEERKLTDTCSLADYASFVYPCAQGECWRAALQAAISEHEHVVIPAREEPYCMDGTVVIPSHRCLSAYGATLLLTEGCRVIMFRNEHTADGMHAPIPMGNEDHDITIEGGRYEESNTRRGGYGKTGRYDEARSIIGVTSLLFFDNLEGLTLRDLTFSHTAGFAVQGGNLRNAVIGHLRFDTCFADGVHLDGYSENLLIRDLEGFVGDDLVALNACDDICSSVNFGPMRTILCEGLKSVGYPALRLYIGTYTYDDGSSVDCSINDTIIRGVSGIRTVKLYSQSAPYRVGTVPPFVVTGSGGDLYFEDMDIDLCAPVDGMPEYKNSDPVCGAFGAFEFGADLGTVTLSDIRLTLHCDKYPYSYLAVCGPKSAHHGPEHEIEIFDPYLSSCVDRLVFHKIFVNGEECTDLTPYIRETVFDNVNGDGYSTGKGTFGQIIRAEE